MLFFHSARSFLVLGAAFVISGCGDTEPKNDPIVPDANPTTVPRTSGGPGRAPVPGVVVGPGVVNGPGGPGVRGGAVPPVGTIGGRPNLPAIPVNNPFDAELPAEMSEEDLACMRAARSLGELKESYCKISQDGDRLCQWLYVTAADGSLVHHQGWEEDCDKTADNVPLTCAAALARI